MVTERRRSGTLGATLSSRRRRAFVGRVSETELFEAALDAEEAPPFSVLYLHGPGGVGKSTLLDVFAGLAESRGRALVRIDGHAVPPTRGEVLETWPAADPEDAGPLVVLIDAYERLAPLDGWIRTTLLPRLPTSAITVVAGRTPPSAAWRADPAWRDLLRVVSLRNLTPEETRAYLRASHVDPSRHGKLVDATHGHPLALSLVTDLLLRGGDVPDDPLTPDLVATLVHRFVDSVPSPQHRRALEVCALARVTTEALLRDALEVHDAHDVFEWLRELSLVETGPHGLVPHDLARDVLDVDLRWRDPESYAEVFKSVRRHIHHRLDGVSGVEQQRAIYDEKFVFRNLPSVLSPVDWTVWGEHYPEPARHEDRRAIVDMITAAEGPESASIAAEWWRRQPEAFHVLRDEQGDVRGVLGLVTLTGGPGAFGFDPGAVAAWTYAERTAPTRPGEVVTQTRFVVDGDGYQGPSPTLNATPILTIQRYMQTPNLAWDFLTLADPDPLNEYFATADLPRASGADFVVGDRTYGLFAHDFRAVPVGPWLELVTDRALAQEPSLPAPAPDLLVLSQAAFADAVRQALRDLSRPDLLARNPLARTRLVAAETTSGEEAGVALARLLGEALDSLRAHPRDDKRWRAVDRTYRRPAPTQEKAAEVLGLPFSTYRRHLSEGVDRVVSHLWDREIYAAPTRRD